MSENLKVVYSINSDINGFLKVVDTPAGRELRSSNNIVVSISDKHKFFFKRYWGIYVEELRKLRPAYKRALCIGLGGGAVQNMLFKLYPGIEVLSLEIDPLMNDIHNFYFSGDQNSNHKILNIDANAFLKYHHRFGNFENYFDLIFLDVFSAMGLDEFTKVSNVYQKSKELLKPNGIFSMSMIVQKEDQFDESIKNLEILKHFYKDIKLAYTGDVLGIANLEVFSSDKIKL
jgi:spermidine synthase